MKYKYIGDGAGVVGLPHEVTDEEAAQMGVSDILAACIENGSYVAVETTPPPAPPQTGERRLERGAKKQKESEVNDG